MPYKTTWKFEKASKEVYDGLVTAVEDLSDSKCPWSLVVTEGSAKVHATRVTKMGWVDDIWVVLSEFGTASGESTTFVQVKSKNREGLYDWGQNKRNCKELYDALPWTPKAFNKDTEVDIPEEFIDIMSAALSGGVEIKDRKWRLKKYKHCFVAKELVDFLCDHCKLGSRSEAVSLGDKMREAQLFAHVVDSKHSFKDEKLFFRFQVCEACLNTEDDAFFAAMEKKEKELAAELKSRSGVKAAEEADCLEDSAGSCSCGVGLCKCGKKWEASDTGFICEAGVCKLSRS